MRDTFLYAYKRLILINSLSLHYPINLRVGGEIHFGADWQLEGYPLKRQKPFDQSVIANLLWLIDDECFSFGQ